MNYFFKALFITVFYSAGIPEILCFLKLLLITSYLGMRLFAEVPAEVPH